MRRRSTIFGIFLTLLLSFTPVPTQGQEGTEVSETTVKRVIIVTLDGLRYDVVNDSNVIGNTVDFPFLNWAIANGLFAEGLTHSNPTLTATGHISIGTGANSSVHGIMGNTYYDWKDNQTYSFFDDSSDPYRNTTTGAHLLQAPQGFHWAEMNGVTSAAITWPYSEGYYNKTVRATYTYAFGEGYAGLPDKNKVTLFFREYDADPSLQLTYIWMRGVDSSSHYDGIKSQPYYDSLKSMDSILKDLVTGLDTRGILNETVVMIMGDHGFAEISDSKFFIEETNEYSEAVSTTGLEPIIAQDAPLSYFYFPGVTDTTKVKEFASILAKNSKVQAVYVNEEHKKIGMYNPQRGMNISVWYKPGVTRNFGSTFTGMHGYLNTNEDMKAAFIMLGGGVNSDAKVCDIRSIDVTPTALKLLGIPEMPQAQGEALTELVSSEYGTPNVTTIGTDVPSEKSQELHCPEPVTETETNTSTTTTTTDSTDIGDSTDATKTPFPLIGLTSSLILAPVIRRKKSKAL